MTDTKRCAGERYGFHRGTYGTFRCQRKAKGTVTTTVGHTRTHPCCGDEQCVRKISGGYPSDWKPYAKE